MSRVFVSYSRNNKDTVTQLVSDMKDAGIDVWYDQAVPGGQRWWENILAEIRKCDIFIFALSPESWDSEACKSELFYVVQLGKPILPVLVSEGININLLSAPLNEIQVADYRRRDKEAAFAVLKSIYTVAPAPPLPDPLPPAPKVPESPLRTLKDRIDSKDPLNSQGQFTLFYDLEQELQEGDSPTETRELLLRLRQREDLLAKIASKIDAALKALEGTDPGPPGSTTDAGQDNRVGAHQPPAKARPCPKCHTQVEAGLNFCSTCGTKVAEPSDVDPPDEVPDMERSESRRYMCKPADTPQLISDLRGWLRDQGFDSKQVNTDNQGVVLEIKKRGDWRKWVGMATALNILIEQAGDTLTVEIGAGQWIDKAGAGAVGMFVFAPMALAAGYGVWEQKKMPDKIFAYIGSRLVHK